SGVRSEHGFFRPESSANLKSGHAKSEQETVGWFDVVQCLIEHGHRIKDINGYNLGQIQRFLSRL
ncbi:MAG: hypothetical protein HN790_16340, partial [Methylococcales bacterium]|nr:hypothetical protein [Methylococcales bacterium]